MCVRIEQIREPENFNPYTRRKPKYSQLGTRSPETQKPIVGSRVQEFEEKNTLNRENPQTYTPNPAGQASVDLVHDIHAILQHLWHVLQYHTTLCNRTHDSNV